MTGATATTPVRERVRDPYWDNVRFVAVVLVVVGHAVEDFTSSATMTALYFVIYAFHMPLFAFVAGHFAKAGPITADTAFSSVRQLVVPYVVSSVIWFGLRRAAEGSARLDLGSPYSFLWFLVALALWRAMLPYLVSLRYPVLISVAISVGAGYAGSVGPTFETGKIFGMLPFFVLGWATRERCWTTSPVFGRLTARSTRVGAVVILAGALALAYLHIDGIRDLRLRPWVRMAANYDDLGRPEWWAGVVRVALAGLAPLLGACVLSLVPRGPRFCPGGAPGPCTSTCSTCSPSTS
ncbi:acyltransferase family protein [Modestobacter altitudinis]|uniref:acyltransferase family protein n=1 Tax=Modestobacter altitudinis TaxID=2213158 RepID=UPI00110D0422|nr:acyltransferase family protein [Modestobacter altitudinis]